MASDLEQTRRNSAILGCLTLSSIFASFSTFLKFAFRFTKKSSYDYCSVSGTYLAFTTDPKLPFSISSIFSNSPHLKLGVSSKYPAENEQLSCRIIKAMPASQTRDASKRSMFNGTCDFFHFTHKCQWTFLKVNEIIFSVGKISILVSRETFLSCTRSLSQKNSTILLEVSVSLFWNQCSGWRLYFKY